MKKNNSIIIVITALFVVAGATVFFMSKDGEKDDHNMMSNMSTLMPISDKANKNSEDYKMFTALKGEAYEKAFLSNMLSHHQGAVDMSKIALEKAKRQEIKDLAKAIITAQTDELAQMESWQKSWGYPSSSGAMMMDHSSMAMESSMEGMLIALSPLKDDAFDKKFLELMIEHHQSAVDMSASGANNAKHQEIKELTAAIVKAQVKEIDQMKQWQKDWYPTN
jgi:uncharacterized protein (DUF305 family)